MKSKTLKTYQFSTVPGEFYDLADDVVAHLRKAFGPSRFTKEQQAANPTKPMTRLVKDVLRVGKWKVWLSEDKSVEWNVTPQVLRRLVKNFDLAKSNGLRFNLIYGHGDPVTKIVSARDLITPLDSARIVGDRLFVTTYANVEQAMSLSNPANQVSVRAVENWVDGQDRTYDLILLHVGVVDTPIVDGQLPFMDLAIPATSTNKEKGKMDFAKLVELLNKLLNMVGLALPDEVTEETLIPTLEVMISTAEKLQGGGETEEAATEGEEPPPPESPNDMALSITELKKMVMDLSNEVRSRKVADAKASYDGELKTLFENGNIDAATQLLWQQQGAKLSYDLSILSPLKGLKMVDLKKKNRTAKTPAPPSVSPGAEALTDDQIAEAVKLIG